MKKISGVKKGICITILCVLLLLFLGTCVLYSLGILPWTRRWFISYSFFHQQADRVAAPYPKELPSSAEDIIYFYHTGWLDTKTGISFTVSDEDYQELKENNLSYFAAEKEDHQKRYLDYKEEHGAKYGDDNVDDWVWYVFNEKVTSGFLEEEKLEYLGEILLNKTGDYTILAYEKRTGGERETYTLQGVFCNDETNEIVMFGYDDVLFNEKQ